MREVADLEVQVGRFAVHRYSQQIIYMHRLLAGASFVAGKYHVSLLQTMHHQVLPKGASGCWTFVRGGSRWRACIDPEPSRHRSHLSVTHPHVLKRQE